MKKFLKKKSVMITFVALALILLCVYVYMLVRPISYGFAYKYSNKVDDSNYANVSVTFLNSKKEKISTNSKVLGIEVKGETESWVIVKGNKIYTVGLTSAITEDGYKAVKDNLPENFWDGDGFVTANAFKLNIGDNTYTCVGAIVFAIVVGVIELGLICLAGYAVVLNSKSKSKKKK